MATGEMFLKYHETWYVSAVIYEQTLNPMIISLYLNTQTFFYENNVFFAFFEWT